MKTIAIHLFNWFLFFTILQVWDNRPQMHDYSLKAFGFFVVFAIVWTLYDQTVLWIYNGKGKNKGWDKGGWDA